MDDDVTGIGGDESLPLGIYVGVDIDAEWPSPSDPYSIGKLCTVSDHLPNKWSLLLHETITSARDS